MRVGADPKAFLFAAAGAVLFGLSTPCSKLLVERADPVLLAAIFYFSGGAFMLVLPGTAFGLAKLGCASRRDLGLLCGSALLGGVVAPILMLTGLRSIDAASASLLFTLEVPFTALLAALFFKEHISARVVAASLLAMAAGALLGFEGGTLNFNGGAFFVAAACFCWGLDNGMVARIEGVSPQTSTAVKGFSAGITNCIIWLLLRGDKTLPDWPVLGGAVLVGFIAYGSSTVLYMVSARRIGAARSQVIFSANPFIGAGASFAVFGAAIANLRQAVAAAGMLAALSLIFSEKHEHLHLHSELEHEHAHSHYDGHHEHSHLSNEAASTHTHKHTHRQHEHSHPHFPDAHHRHTH